MERDRPGVIAPPPAIFSIPFLIGYLCRNFLPRFAMPATGIGMATAGLAILVWAIVTMLRARTHIEPYKPALHLVTGGPYRFTRNPIYLGLTLIYIGAALTFGILAALALLPMALILLHFGVIRREERYLEAKFGDRYRDYRSHVRRWT